MKRKSGHVARQEKMVLSIPIPLASLNSQGSPGEQGHYSYDTALKVLGLKDKMSCLVGRSISAVGKTFKRSQCDCKPHGSLTLLSII